MEEQWIEALTHLVHGIYVLTAAYEDRINGMIASWVSQVSYDPPLIMVAVHPNRYSHRLIEKANAFALHILSRNQKDFLRRFKGPDPLSKFTALEWTRGKTGCPILKDCLGYLDCRVKTSLKLGNHTLFFGELIDAQMFGPGSPMNTLDYEGTYLGKD
jgi:flavin reductase (DIM6/NTAB) family NADH-FMN oxidoreductase RutF